MLYAGGEEMGSVPCKAEEGKGTSLGGLRGEDWMVVGGGRREVGVAGRIRAEEEGEARNDGRS